MMGFAIAKPASKIKHLVLQTAPKGRFDPQKVFPDLTNKSSPALSARLTRAVTIGKGSATEPFWPRPPSPPSPEKGKPAPGRTGTGHNGDALLCVRTISTP